MIPEVKAIVPSERDFYSKLLNCRGIPIKSGESVADEALVIASQRMNKMLRDNPVIVRNLIEHGAEMHIIGKNQVTSDLPEHRYFKGKKFPGSKIDFDKRTRGVGGLYASCGEENLLNLQNDRYFGRDICVHEFAHTIYTFGVDQQFRIKFRKRYRAAKRKGLWPRCYAATCDEEFFAELSMWYFGTRGDGGKISPPPIPGPEWLKSHDRESFELLENLYLGLTPIGTNPSNILEPCVSKRDPVPRSITAKIPVAIKFVNTKQESFKLSWIDYRGQPIYYAHLADSEVFTQRTYETHPWLVSRESGEHVAIYFPKQELSTVML